METAKKVTIDLYDAQLDELDRIKRNLAESQGRATTSDAIRYAILKAAKGLPK